MTTPLDDLLTEAPPSHRRRASRLAVLILIALILAGLAALGVAAIVEVRSTPTTSHSLGHHYGWDKGRRNPHHRRLPPPPSWPRVTPPSSLCTPDFSVCTG